MNKITVCAMGILILGVNAGLSNFWASMGTVDRYSLNFADGNGYRTRVHLFNGDPHTARSIQLTAVNDLGQEVPLLMGNTGNFSGTLFPFESLFLETVGTGPGLHAGFFNLEATTDIAAWSQVHKVNQLSFLEESRSTSGFIGQDEITQDYVFSHTVATAEAKDSGQGPQFGGDDLMGFFGARNTSPFSSTLTLTALDPDSGVVADQSTFVINANRGIFSTLSSLLDLPSPGDYIIQAESGGAAIFPFTTRAGNGTLSQIFGPSSPGFSATRLSLERGDGSFEPQRLPAFHLDDPMVSSTYHVASAVGSPISGDAELRLSTSPEMVEALILSNGNQGARVSFTADDVATTPPVDYNGTMTVELVTRDASTILEINGPNAHSQSEGNGFGDPSPRIALSIDGSESWDTDMAQSRVIVHLAGTTDVLVGMANLDEDGNRLTLDYTPINPGPNAFSVDDLVVDTTAVLLLEPASSAASLSVEMVVHGSGPSFEGDILDMVKGMSLPGDRTIGQFPALLEYWNQSETDTCYTGRLSVLAITDYLNRDYACP